MCLSILTALKAAANVGADNVRIFSIKYSHSKTHVGKLNPSSETEVMGDLVSTHFFWTLWLSVQVPPHQNVALL